MYAEVAFPISSYRTFTYRIPAELSLQSRVGMRVRAPLGKRTAQGIIVSKKKQARYRGPIKPIHSLVDDQPVLDSYLWRLIEWVSQYYLTPIGQAARAALPSRLSTRYQPPTRWTVLSRVAGTDPDLKKRAPAQARVLNFLQDRKEFLPLKELKGLVKDPAATCKRLAEKGWVELRREPVLADATGFSFEPLPKTIRFTPSQQAVLEVVGKKLAQRRFHPYLLEGVTGSGKTEIYIDIARQVLQQGRTAILLLPEISLTPQIGGRFRAVFGEAVALWHSKLTPAARAWTWKRICNGDFKVVIGARSAVFAPLKNLGLLVVDEEQESAYKQESPPPRYHAREVALMRGRIHQAVVVLASATPSLESYHNQLQNKYTHLRLPQRFGGAQYPRVYLVDMNQEQEQTGRWGQVFSGLLLEKIAERLSRREQVILLQNRRGYAPALRCGDCGEVETCPHCQLTLTYHRAGNSLRCHFCGYRTRRIPTLCPHCRSSALKLMGTGTQKVEDLIAKTFPSARLARLDLDTARSGSALNRILQRFGRGQTDILLGTQMIAKGLDFPNATLVGIINGDMGLYLPDFRSGERVFQLIYQAAGRAGRREKPGEVVIQTYNPANPVIQHASRLDLKTYYQVALNERRELNYPPFSWMIKIGLTGPRIEQVERFASRLREQLARPYRGLEILGPARCYRERLQNRYRLQIVLRSSKREDPNGLKLHRYLNSFLEGEEYRRPTGGVALTVDVNPLSLL